MSYFLRTAASSTSNFDNSSSKALLLSPGSVASGGQYSSTSKLESCSSSQGSSSASPKLTRKISRSSEDVRSSSRKPKEVTAGLKNVASKFLGVVELDPATGDLHVRGGGSLQKDLNVASHVLEEGAVETAAIIEKGVLNPFTKLTKGLGAVLKGQSEMTSSAGSVVTEASFDVPTTDQSSRLTSQNIQVANQLLKMKVAEANSQTKVLLL